MAGDSCPFAHGREEAYIRRLNLTSLDLLAQVSYHPAKYKTRPCNGPSLGLKYLASFTNTDMAAAGTDCRGEGACCFAHDETEMRPLRPSCNSPPHHVSIDLCNFLDQARRPRTVLVLHAGIARRPERVCRSYWRCLVSPTCRSSIRGSGPGVPVPESRPARARSAQASWPCSQACGLGWAGRQGLSRCVQASSLHQYTEDRWNLQPESQILCLLSALRSAHALATMTLPQCPVHGLI